MAQTLGGTISELQARMPLGEVRIWRAYRKKHGPMNDARRHDRPAALIAEVLCLLLNRTENQPSPKLEDFMPQWRADVGEVDIEGSDIEEQNKKIFGGIKIGKRG